MEIEDYILKHSDAVPSYLNEIERNTYLNEINPRMCSGALQGRVLSTICKMINPTNILELGTFTGYSTLCMAETLPQNGNIDTIEIDDELEPIILENFSKSPYHNLIKLHIGDALKIIDSLDKIYDISFIDADKKQYNKYYDAIFPKVKTNGYIIIDNTLWNNKVIEKVDPKDKQTIEILRFNQRLKQDNRVERLILPIRDGLTIVRKIV